MGAVACGITISVDGSAAGPEQSRENPLGIGAEELHRWMFEAADENRAEVDAILGHGAYIMGRNMFGPIRGAWDDPADERRKGWWGPEPPYRVPVLVLTHRLHIAPIVLGARERLFASSGRVALRPVAARATSLAAHLTCRVGPGPRR